MRINLWKNQTETNPYRQQQGRSLTLAQYVDRRKWGTAWNRQAVEIGESVAQSILRLLRGQSFDISPFKSELVIRESVAKV